MNTLREQRLNCTVHLKFPEEKSNGVNFDGKYINISDRLNYSTSSERLQCINNSVRLLVLFYRLH